MTAERAEDVIRPLGVWTIHRPGHADILSAIRLQRKYRLSWWNAMVLNSAIRTDATVLWTEDMNHGQRFGDLTIRNPFA